MSAVGAWILSILGVVIIGVIIDLVLPNGRMNKYIRSVFSTVTVLIIIFPLPNLLKNGCNTSDFIYNDTVILQENYIEYTAQMKKRALLRGLVSALQEDGISVREIELEGDFTQVVPIIEKVSINLSQVVIVGQSEHINKYKLIQSKVSAYLAIDEDIIRIYEQ